jgi:hypothetical protein
MAKDDLLDLDEDLFDFDELLRDVEQLTGEDLSGPVTELVDDASELPSPPAPLPSGAAPAAAAPTSMHRPQRRPPPVAPRAEAPTAPVSVALAARPAPETLPVEPPRRGFVAGRGTLVALSAVAVLHLAVLVLVVQAIGAVRGMMEETGGRTAAATADVREPTAEVASGDPAPLVAPPAEGQAALERAGELLRRGEHQRARETLYALLAVIDRLPAATRRDVEARARFLVADTWRLEAEASEELAAVARGTDAAEQEARR